MLLLGSFLNSLVTWLNGSLLWMKALLAPEWGNSTKLNEPTIQKLSFLFIDLQTNTHIFRIMTIYNIVVLLNLLISTVITDCSGSSVGKKKISGLPGKPLK